MDLLVVFDLINYVVSFLDGETLIDSVPLNSFSYFYDWQEGASIQLHHGITDPQINDQEQMWCDSIQNMGGGDFGTPNQLNRPCPI